MSDFQKEPPVHVIRLRGPAWLVYQQEQQQKQIRVKTPCEIDHGIETECIVSRNIGGPSGLESDQRMELAFSGFKSVVSATLNESPLAINVGQDEFSVDVTDVIGNHNKLIVSFSPPGFFGNLELRIIG